MDPILLVSDLHKDYVTGPETVRALDGLSLSVEAGQFVGIMGASGSGKSTLLHLLGGLDQATSGRILVEGHDLAAMSDRQRTLFRRRRLGVVFQTFNLLPTLTALENAALPLLVGGNGAADIEARARSLLEQVDMGHRGSHRPQALSGGEQQRVAIARALINNPAIVLADEPTGNLDSKHSEEIWQLLGGLAHRENRTVIAVTHEAAGAAHTDRVVVLKDGRIVGEFNPPSEPSAFGGSGSGHAALVAARYAELAG